MTIICIGIVVLLFAADVVIKQHIEDHFEKGEKQAIFNQKAELRKAHNYGFAMNLFEKKPNIVKIGSVTGAVILAFYSISLFFKKGRMFEKLGVAFALGGAFSNMYDRIVRGYVVDYIGFKTKWERLRKMTFNLGDFGIFFGAFLILVFGKRK